MRTSSVKPEAFDPEQGKPARRGAANDGGAAPQGGFSARLKAAASEVNEQQDQRERAAKSDALVRRRLSALKALAPLMLALMKRPGYDAEDGELHAAVQLLRAETERASKDLLGVLGGDDAPPWLAGSAATIVAEAVAAEWTSGARVLDMSPYQPIWGHLAESEFTDYTVGLPDLGASKDGDMMLRLSLLKAMSQVVATTRRSYLMRHEPEKLYPMLADAMLQVAKTNLPKLVDNETSEAARVMALQSLIGKCADVLCAHWDAVVRPTVQRLLAMDKKERLALYQKNPNGLPLDAILTGFSVDVARIVAGMAAMDPRAKPLVSLSTAE